MNSLLIFSMKVEILHLSRRSMCASAFFKERLILLIKCELYRFLLKIPFTQIHSKNVFSFKNNLTTSLLIKFRGVLNFAFFTIVKKSREIRTVNVN